MKKMDTLGLKLCSYQAKLFELSIGETKCSTKIFIRRFMNSKLAERMDSVAFLFESIAVSDAIAEIESEYGESSYGCEKFSAEEMHWIGYIYRYWAYISAKPSSCVYKLVKPEQLRKVYFPYHSLDPLQAIERIMEDLGLENDLYLDDISKGVIAMRKVRSKYLNLKCEQ